MAEKQMGSEKTDVTVSSPDRLPRIDPRVVVGKESVAVEFRIEDLVRRIIPSAAGHCGGCYGCSGCSH